MKHDADHHRAPVDHLLAADDAARRRPGGDRRPADRPHGLARDRPERRNTSCCRESNRVQLIPVPPRRGWIIDRNGKPIAINRSSFRVDIIPQQLVDGPEGRRRASPDLLEPAARRGRPDQPRACRIARLPAGLGRRQRPLRAICRDHRAAARAARGRRVARLHPLLSRRVRRSASWSAMSAPRRPPNMRRRTRTRCCSIPGVKIGKEGLEQTMESDAARPARRAAGRSHRARQAGQGARPQARPQRRHRPADHRLPTFTNMRRGGSATSRLRSSSSTSPTATSSRCRRCPRSIPNNFSDGISNNEWKMLSGDDHLPLVDKALESLYPSGSTIKPSMAMALLNAGDRPHAEGQLHRRLSARQPHLPLRQAARSGRYGRGRRPQLRRLFLHHVPARRRGQARRRWSARWASARSSTCRSTTSATGPSPTPTG